MLWGYAVLLARHRLSERSRLLVVLSGLVWIWSLFVGSTPFELHDTPALFVLVASLAAVFWGIRDLAALESDEAAELGLIGVGMILYFTTFFWHAHGEVRSGLGTVPLGALGTLAAGGVLLALRAPGDRPSSPPAAVWSLRGIVLLPVALGFVLMFLEAYRPVAVAANLGVIGLCVWLMVEGVRAGVRTRINLGTFVLGVLILTRFLDYFGTMLESGVGFIVTGALLIAVAWLLNRGRLTLLERAGGSR
jgi:hypothetical protein